MHIHLLHRALAHYYLPSVISETVNPYVFVWILTGTEIWGSPRRQTRIGRIPPQFLDCTACGRCHRRHLVCILLLQMEEEIASKDPGLAVVGTRRTLAWICPYVSGREVSISIVNLIIEFGRNRRARI